MSQTLWKMEAIHPAVELELQHLHVSTSRAHFNRLSGAGVLDNAQPENRATAVPARTG